MNKKLFTLCMATLPLTAMAGVEIDQPKGGWRHSSTAERYTQEVHYPAASVNTPADTGATALISGHIESTPKDRIPGSPATLIVNGTAMPLKIESDGRFSRP